MNKENQICVSTTPEEMYRELKAERELIRQNGSISTAAEEMYTAPPT